MSKSLQHEWNPNAFKMHAPPVPLQHEQQTMHPMSLDRNMQNTEPKL